MFHVMLICYCHSSRNRGFVPAICQCPACERAAI